MTLLRLAGSAFRCTVVLSLLACSPAPETADVSATLRLTRTTEHFAIASSGLDSATIAQLGAFLEDQQARVVKDLGASPMGMTPVIIQSKEEFDAKWGASITSAGIGFQPQALTGPDGGIYVYGPWARRHPGDALGHAALHEFAHAVTRRTALDHIASTGRDTAAYLIPDSVARNVRWLSEAIATYEAGQSTDLNRFLYLIRGRYPSINALNDPSNGQIYQIGYRLAEYIVKMWGTEGLVRLIQHDGNVPAALGITEDELMRRWFAYVEDRYLLVKPRWFSRAR